MIKFKYLRLKNFLSYGNNFQQFDFNIGITRISGLSGHGKSTIIDALYFALFGKPYRNIKLKQLINFVNKKNLIVELVFEKKNDIYKIIRGLQPNIFEIYKNDKLIDQTALKKDYQKILVEDILQFDEIMFNQIMLKTLTKQFTFFKLSKSQKREIIENIFQLKIFSVMKDVLKEWIVKTEQKLLQVEDKINNYNELLKNEEKRLKELENLKKQLQQQNKQKLNEIENDIKKYNNEIERYKLKKGNLKKKLKELKKKIKDIENIEKEIKQYETRLKSIKKIVNIFEKYCKGCEKIEIIKKEQKEDEIVKNINELKEKVKNKIDIEEEIKRIDNEIQDYCIKIKTYKKYISKLQDDKDKIYKQEIQIDIKWDKYNEYKQKINEYKKIRQKLKKKLQYFKSIDDCLKDNGIKSYILKYYLPTFNKLLNTYINKFQLSYRLKFNEEFNEELYGKGGKDLSFDNLSEGEKKRMELSLMFTIIDFFKMQIGGKSNLLILDEVTSGLDIPSENLLFQILRELVEKEGKCIIVINHSLLDHDKFDYTYEVEKKGVFSILNKK